MEAKSRLAVFPSKAVLVAVALLAALAFLAGGYAIRLATASSSSPAPVHASVISGPAAPGLSDAGCVTSGDHRGC